MEKESKLFSALAITFLFVLTGLICQVSAEDISACSNLSSANTVYSLTSNVTFNSTCFNISSSNITLNCNGFTINYSANGTVGYGVYSNQFNTTVKNCAIVEGITTNNAKNGIYFLDAIGGLIQNNSVKTIGASSIGIKVSQSTGNPDNNTIDNNRINTSGTSGTGIYVGLSYSDDNNITNNIVTTSGNGGDGIIIASYSNRNRVVNNTVTVSFSTAKGITIQTDSDNNTLDKNIIISGNYGIFISNGEDNNNLTNNSITTSTTSAYGIYINIDSDYNILNNNFINTTSSTSYGIYLDGSSGSCKNNQFNNNDVFTSGSSSYGVYIKDDVYDSVFNNLNVLTTHATTAYGLAINTDKINTTIIDSIINATSVNDIYIGNDQDPGSFLELINVTFNKSDVTILNKTGMIVKWHLDVNVTNSTSQLDSAVANASYSNGTLISSLTTGTSGIVRFNLTEYTQNFTGEANKTYFDNYIINVTRAGYDSYGNGTINMSNNALLNIRINISEAGDIDYPLFSDNLTSIANGSQYNPGNSYGFNITITNTNGTAGIEFNGTNYTMSNSSFVFNKTFPTLGAGNYNYYYWAYGNGTSHNFNYSGTFSYTIAQNSSYNLSIIGATPIIYPAVAGISNSSCTSQIICNLYRNDTAGAITSPDNSVLGAGNYNYTFNSSGNANYSAKSTSFALTVSQNTSAVVYTYLNNSRSNITINNNSAILLNATLLNVTGTINLYKNGTLINLGNSPVSNLTAFNGTGLYNITAIYSGNANYSGAYETWFVNVTNLIEDNSYPLFSDYQDNNGSIVSGGDALFNVTVINTNGTVLLEINGTNYTATNLSADNYNASVSGLLNGTYSYKWHSWGNGTNKNYNASSTRSYSVNQSDPTQISGCSVLSLPNTVYTQISNINVDVSPCINITAQNITFNGNGKWIKNTSLVGIGIYSNQYNTTILNCNISLNSSSTGYVNKSSAIKLVGVNNSTVDNCYFYRNWYAIYMDNGSGNNEIINNSIYNRDYQNNGVKGIYILNNSNNNRLINNSIGPSGNGVSVYNSQHNLISYNNASIYLEGSSNNNLTNNIADYFTDGIYFDSSFNNSIYNNSLKYNSAEGIYFYASYSNNITGNNISYNSINGIFLDTGSYGNIISGNNINDNRGLGTGDGMEFESDSDNNSIINNNISNNNFYGMEISSNSNFISGNNLDNNGDNQIYFINSINNTIVNNSINNSYVGIYLSSSSNNNFTNNNIWNCTANSQEYGCFYMTYSHNNTVSGGVFNLSSKHLISMSSSNNNLFRDLQLIGATKNDSYLGSTYGNNTNNTFLNVSYNISREYVAAGSQLIKTWYYRGIVNDSNGNNISNANISIYDAFGNNYANLTTNSSGWTDIITITDYINNGTRIFYSPYLINATNGSSYSNHSYNSSQGNNLQDVFTFNMSSSYIAPVEAAPSSGGGGGGGSMLINKTNCTYDWICGNWSECVFSNQTRKCINNGTCNGNLGKPDEVKECNLTKPEKPWNPLNGNDEFCRNWGKCMLIYNLDDIISGNVLLKMEQECMDNKKIKRECDERVPITTGWDKKCQGNYLEVYDLNNLILRLELIKGIYKELNIYFNLDRSEFCPYCFNGIKDFDEDETDCSYSQNSSCPACFSASGQEKKASLFHLLVFLLLILLIILALIFLSKKNSLKKRLYLLSLRKKRLWS